MLTAERHRAILRLLSEQGSITMSEIARRFNVSAATARRDAVCLATSGRAARSHGGLLPAQFYWDRPAARPAVDRQAGLKEEIAREAAQLVPHEGSVFVDAGRTCLEVGRCLLNRPQLRIYTHSIPLLELAAEANAVLIGVGGDVAPGRMALTGPLTQSWLSHLRFDAAVFGAAGLDPGGGAYASEPRDAAAKSEVLRRSSMRILAAEAEKWRLPAPIRFAPWSSFTSFVTDRGLPREARISLAAEKVKLRLV